MIRLAIVNECELVAAGVAEMLCAGRHGIHVTALDPSADTLGSVDVILYDAFAPAGSLLQLEDLVRRSGVPVIVYSWQRGCDVRELLARGAVGHLSKAATASQIVDSVHAVLRGEVVVGAQAQQGRPVTGESPLGADPSGLTPREAEVLTMIASGLSNQEIAGRSHLSVNTVKSYIRSAYRKIGVDCRSRAILWAVTRGFAATQAPASDRGRSALTGFRPVDRSPGGTAPGGGGSS